jgi:heme-degrading monooxygenase HmoA
MRRVTVHKKRNLEDEELLIVTCWEEGIKKEDLKKWNLFSKQHEVLARNGQGYEFKEKRT